MSLSATWGTYEVEPVAVVDGEPFSLGAYRIRHPTAREAITLLESGEAAAGGDEDAWASVRHALRSWLPLRLFSLLVSERISQANAVRISSALLSVGLPESEKEEHDKRKKKAEAKWSELVAMYRHAYPQGSLDEPWPFWLDQVMQVDVIRSRDTMEAFQAHAIARTGSKESLASLRKRARYEEPEWDEEEALERQKRSLERLKGLHHQMRKGKRIGSA